MPPVESRQISLDELLRNFHLDIICLSDASWDWILWTNRQYALSTLARLYDNLRILYVETPSFALRRARTHSHTWPSGAPIVHRKSAMPFCTEMQDRIWILRPPLPVPYRMVREKFGAILHWEVLLLTRLARRWLRFGPTILWAYTPYAGWYADRLECHFRIYECLDEHSTAAFYAWDSTRLLHLEETFMRKADAVFTVSPRLQTRKAFANPNTIMVGNPVNYDLFAQAQQRNQPCPPEFVRLTGPILGFYGALANYKIDFDLLFGLATAKPEWNLVLIGPVQNDAVNKLGSLSNVLLLPGMPQEKLIRYLAWIDVLLMPYRTNEYTLSSRPLKIHEYFATGKPVVSTYVPAEAEYHNLMYLAQNTSSFVKATEQALQEKDLNKSQQRCKIAREHTWENKVNVMLTYMVQRGLLEKLDVASTEK
jgi:glycosyltransferase involved in cell wall biosynthesis